MKINGEDTPLLYIILISRILAIVKYMFMIPTNRLGFISNEGSFSLLQLKIIQ